MQPSWLGTLLVSALVSGLVSWIVASITTATKRRVDEEIQALDEYSADLEAARRTTQRAINSQELHHGVLAIDALHSLCRTIDTLMQRFPQTSRVRAKTFGENVRRALDAPETSDMGEALAEMEGLPESIEAEIRSVESDRARMIGH